MTLRFHLNRSRVLSVSLLYGFLAPFVGREVFCSALVVKVIMSVGESFRKMAYDEEEVFYPLTEEWSRELSHSFKYFINNERCSGTSEEAALLVVPDANRYSINHQQWKFFHSSNDTARAVECARKASGGWRNMHDHERAKVLHRISVMMKMKLNLLAELESQDSQKPLQVTLRHTIPFLCEAFSSSSSVAELWKVEMKQWMPVGVVAISSYYFSVLPLFISVCQLLAAGNTVVVLIQPYHLTPILLAQIFRSSGLPAGVFNIVVSQSVTDIAGCSVDKVVLYLPNKLGEDEQRIISSEVPQADVYVGMLRPVAVVLSGADVDSAASCVLEMLHTWDMAGCRGCLVLVQECVRPLFLSKLEELFRACRHSSVMHCPWSTIFPEHVVVKMERRIRQVLEQGGKVIKMHETDLPCCKMSPILLSNLQMDSSILEEELVGPLISVLPFRTAKEFIDVINSSDLKRPVSLWTNKLMVAMELAMQVKSGIVFVNSQKMEPASCTYFTGSMYLGGRRGLLSFTKPAWQQNAVICDIIRPRTSDTNDSEHLLYCESKASSKFRIYYGGQYQESGETSRRSLYCYHGQVMCVMSEGNAMDSRCAVRSARSAAFIWCSTEVQQRSRILLSIAIGLEKKKCEFSVILCESTMSSLKNCEQEVEMAVQRLYYWAAQAQRSSGAMHETYAYLQAYEKDVPHGVISVFCPNKSPLLSFVSLMAPAIAKGNSVVMVPSEMHPIPSLKLCEVFEECHIPEGVINVLTGFKTSKLNHVSLYQDVDALWIHCDTGDDEKFKTPLISGIAPWKKWISGERDWTNPEQGQSEEFTLYATCTKTICLSSGSILLD